MKDETRCVHAIDKSKDNPYSVVPAISNSTAYHYIDKGPLIYPGFSSTPNQERLGQIIANLEGADFGIAFSSGMAAITSAILSLVKAGDHIIWSKELYGGTQKFAHELNERQISCSFVNGTIEGFEAARRTNTKLVFVESPSNPTLKIIDLKAVSDWAQNHKLITVIDNTFATPINQRPLALGFDIVLHSGTKFLGGHNDLMFGGLATKWRNHYESIRNYTKLYGGSLDAHSCYLAERSIKTLSLRVRQQNESALNIAHFLQDHPMISKVYYPGLSTHENHEIARKQMSGFGGLLSFQIEASPTKLRDFLSSLTLISPALSLGGVESLICIPALTSHSSLSPEQRKELNIADNLIRLSVGIEHSMDLIEDITMAIQQISTP
ncbi:MAG: PLP-dependent aspartate aminotransferase family protein [Marinoscillum sp.]